MPGRRWSDGLHQAVEAKEGLTVQEENQTLATVTFQNFFRMYNKLAGMTGTAETEASEFHQTYELETTVIPTNKPIARLDEDDVVYRSYREKFNAIVEEILRSNEKGQPVLVGTTSVEKSEAISRVLRKKGIEHFVLNAKLHSKEATIVTQAGRPGAVTIATNMAGRGTDILLGGNPEGLAEDEVGEQNVPETAIGDEREEYWTDEYKAALKKYKAQCEAAKKEVLESGGLMIIGTERHESRRIDNQLRGRAGRQGDPGRSRFFLSLEDDLLRLFGADRIAKIMDTLKMEEGVPIEHPMVTKSLENAQKKVEGRNFDIRKNLLEYDDVMDVQRKTIYELRKNVLRGEDEDGRDIKAMSIDLFEELALTTIDSYASRAVRADDWDLEGLTVALREIFGFEIHFEENLGRDEVERRVWSEAEALFNSKVEMCDEVAGQINSENAGVRKAQDEAKANMSDDDDNDWMISDEDLQDIEGITIFHEQVQNHYLQSIDKYWRQHLQAMEQLRDGIGMRGYAQKDPKKEYKKEGYNLFLDLLMNIKTSVVQFVSQFAIRPRTLLQRQPQHQVPKQITLNRSDEEAPAPDEAEQETFRRELPKLGRNDPCWCGSGKKYKSCHMRQDQAAAS